MPLWSPSFPLAEGLVRGHTANPDGPKLAFTWSGSLTSHHETGEAMGASSLERSAFTGPGGSVSPLSPGTLDLACERVFLLAMGLPRTVAQTLKWAQAPSARAAYSYCWRVFELWYGQTR